MAGDRPGHPRLALLPHNEDADAPAGMTINADKNSLQAGSPGARQLFRRRGSGLFDLIRYCAIAATMMPVAGSTRKTRLSSTA